MYQRMEYKYLVHKDLLKDIKNDIMPYVNFDQNTKLRENNEYTVRSIYYDTPRLDCYNEKIEGLKERKKYRIRGYNDAGQNAMVFIEIKRKYISHMDKNRAPILRENLENFLQLPDIDKHIISISGNGKEKTDAHKFLYYYYKLGLHPSILIIYEREAFFGKFDRTLRLTFDKNLRSSLYPSVADLYSENKIKISMCEYLILEIKFFREAIPRWIQLLIKRYNLTRMALSKYTICMDSHKEFKQRIRNPIPGL